MNDGAVLEFHRGRGFFYLCVCLSAILGLNTAWDVYEREVIPWAWGLGFTVFFGACAVVWRLPYVRVTQETLTVRLSPTRMRKVMPWSSIRSARRNGANLVELTLLDGKTVGLRVDVVEVGKRDALVGCLEEMLEVQLGHQADPMAPTGEPRVGKRLDGRSPGLSRLRSLGHFPPRIAAGLPGKFRAAA